ncbi:MAG: hypothetical protein V1799_18580 [bacterium]
MNLRKHVYYVTRHDIQRVATDTINRKLNNDELTFVIEKMIDRIIWYEPIQQTIEELASIQNDGKVQHNGINK